MHAEELWEMEYCVCDGRQAVDRIIKKQQEREENDTSLFILNGLGFVLLLRHKTLCDRLI